MIIITINSPLTWKIHKTNTGFSGTCGRLNLSLEADTLQDLVNKATATIYSLFKYEYNNGQLNEFCFKHSTAYKIETFNGFLDIQVPLILED